MRSPKLDFATAPEALIADLRAAAEKRGITPSAAVREAIAAWLGRAPGPTPSEIAADIIAHLKGAGLMSDALFREICVAVKKDGGKGAKGR